MNNSSKIQKMVETADKHLVKKARQIDTQHPNFSNQPLPPLQSTQQIQPLVR